MTEYKDSDSGLSRMKDVQALESENWKVEHLKSVISNP